MVFTLPAPVGAIAFQSEPRVRAPWRTAAVYAILFRAAAETLRVIAADPRHLGAEIGGIAVLHTWGQAMQHHPHVHCIVPGGGLSPDRRRWIACPPGFFLSVKVLGRLFRRLFLERLAAAFAEGGLRFFGELAPLAEPHAFAAHCAALRRIDRVVIVPEARLRHDARCGRLGCGRGGRAHVERDRLVGTPSGAINLAWRVEGSVRIVAAPEIGDGPVTSRAHSPRERQDWFPWRCFVCRWLWM